jgi:aldehyde:ferredoxin oxidoreductase
MYVTGMYGYAGRILEVDLSSGNMTHLLTVDYADRFVGGRGVAARIYWDEVLPDIRAFEPENCLIFMTGPLAGVRGLAGPRWEICGKSPAVEPEQFCYCNLGGRWGVQLKFAGYDGLIIQGKAEKPTYLLIQDGVAELKDASGLWGKGAIEVREILKSEVGSLASVVAIGPAGENMVIFANLLADNDASGSSGFGAVMGSKKLKAVVVRGSGKIKVANPEKLRQLTKYARELKKESTEPESIGLITGPKMKRDYCYGCPGGCFRATFEATDGTKGKFMCVSGLFYQRLAREYYGEWNEVPFYANKLCDQYGLDTGVLGSEIIWLYKCHRAGLLTDRDTGLPLLT